MWQKSNRTISQIHLVRDKCCQNLGFFLKRNMKEKLLYRDRAKAVSVDNQRSHVHFQGALFHAVLVLLRCTIAGKQCLRLKKPQICSHCPPKPGASPHSPKTVALSVVRQKNYPHKAGFRDSLLLIPEVDGVQGGFRTILRKEYNQEENTLHRPKMGCAQPKQDLAKAKQSFGFGC